MRICTLAKIALIFALTTATFAARPRASAVFLTIGPGARASGMGETFVSVANDPTATFWNPAGLGKYPLSSRWYEFSLKSDSATTTDDERLFAIVKTARSEVDFRKFDLWAGNYNTLKLLRRDRWFDAETYSVEDPDGETIREILRQFCDFGTYDSTFFAKISRDVMTFNSFTDTIIPAGKELKIPFTYFIPDSITALGASDKVLWVGTKNGLYRYAAGEWAKISDADAPKGVITVVTADANDDVWIGTTRGLFQKRGNKYTSYTVTNGLPSSHITAIYPSNRRDVWVGTLNGPAMFTGGNFKKDFAYKVETGKTWEQVVKDLTGTVGDQKLRILVSTLSAYNKSTDATPPPENIRVPFDFMISGTVRSIYIDESDRVWFGTDFGLLRYADNSFTAFGWTSDSLEKAITLENYVAEKWSSLSSETRTKLIEKIRAFGFLNNNNLQAGEKIEIPTNPVSGEIYDLARGFVPGEVLIASEYGLLKYVPSMRQFRYVLSGGLAQDKISMLAQEGGEYWFGSKDALKVYSQGKPGISLMHVRWLPELADDIYYEYLSGAYYVEDWGTLGGAITFISLGKNDQTNEAGEVVGSFFSYETAVAVSYGTKILPNLYGGLTFKFIYSALAPGIVVAHEKKSGTGTSFAIDAGVLYDTPLKGLTLGACVSNIGPNIQYIDAAQADPLPRILRTGLSYKLVNTDYQKLVLTGDVEKWIVNGLKDPDNPWALEWRYAVKHLGAEYSYSNFFSLRGGYILDYDYYPKDDDKVNADDYEYDSDDYVSANYFTFGLGIRYSNFQFDFAYIPKAEDPENRSQNLPLSDIKRFSITMEF